VWQRSGNGETGGLGNAVCIRHRIWQPHRQPVRVEFGGPRPGGIQPGRRPDAGHLARRSGLLDRDQPTTKAIESAASKAGLSGISAATLQQDIASVQKLHGVIVFDVKSAVDSPDHFAHNLSAYCGASDVTDFGAAGVPLLKSVASAEFAQVKATHITQRQIKVGGVPGVETSYQLTSSTEGTLHGTQIEVLPAQNKICFVTVTVGKGVSDASVVSTAAATAQFP
jgi:hypothetical protein